MREQDDNICHLVIILLNFIKKTIFRSQCYLFARFLFAESVRLDFFFCGFVLLSVFRGFPILFGAGHSPVQWEPPLVVIFDFTQCAGQFLLLALRSQRRQSYRSVFRSPLLGICLFVTDPFPGFLLR
jgi:hypothetical protein